LDLQLADIVKDEKILKFARNLAAEILEKDPKLELPQNSILSQRLLQLQKHRSDWSKIS